MADEQIRVVISGTAAELRKALEGAKGDLGGLSAAIKAVPDKLKVDVQAETAVAVARLKALQIQAGLIPDQINIQANADTGVAEAKLALLQAKAGETERAIARAELGGSFLAATAGGRGGGGGGGGGVATAAAFGGGGLLGLAGAGSAASFAGLDATHLIMTALGLAGFAGAGLAGGGLLGAGAAGTLAVGGGVDAAVMKSTIADTKTLYTNYQQLQSAVAIYGAGSHQAALAQAQLNLQVKQLGPAAGAELGLAKQVSQLNTAWDKLTAPARIQAVAILGQGVKAGFSFLPLIAAAAERNLSIVDHDIKPLFAWLEGPQGVGIFLNLENHFAQHLPTAIHAFTQGLELLLRIVSIASNYTGGFTKHLDELLTRLNSKSNQQLNQEIGKLIEDFRDWEALLKLAAEDVYLLFHADAGTAPAIVDSLTQMLQRLHDWEASTRGQASIHNIFVIHRDEILAILQVLPLLIMGFGRLYLVLAPLLVPIVTLLATGLGELLKVILDLGKTSGILENTLVIPLGLLAVSAKLFGASKIWDGIRATGAAFNLWPAATVKVDAQTAALNENTAALRANAAAGLGTGGSLRSGANATTTTGGAVASTVEKDASTGMMAGLKSGAIRGLAIGGIGTLLSQGIGDSVGGGVGTAISNIGTSASIGAGFGAIFGPEGIAGGALIGGLVGSVLTFINHDAADQGKQWADKFTASLPGEVSKKTKQGLADAVTKAADAPKPGTPRAEISLLPGERLSGPQFTRQFNTAFNTAFNAAYAAGQKTGQAFVDGMQKVKVPTEPLLLRDIRQRLSKPPPGLSGDQVTFWREAAAKQMLAYATSLEQKGKLPKRSVDNMIASLEQSFPGLIAFLDRSGAGSETVIANHFKFTHARDVLRQTLKDFGTQWDDTRVSQGLTVKNMVDRTGLAMDDLRSLMHDKNRKVRQEATAEYELLRKNVAATFDAMTKDTVAKQHELTDAIQKGSASAAHTAGQNLADFEHSVTTAMSSGILSAVDGANKIGAALNATLKAFGTKPIPLAALIASESKHQQVFIGGGHAGTFAGGGLVQIGREGERGRDAIGLSVGGQNIVVGAGEQVAVFNHDQQQVMNQRLGDMGGLPGMFAKHSRPHHMATGGYVYPNAPGAVGERIDQGKDFGGAFTVGAMGPGVVLRNTIWPGWPGVGGVVYRLTGGPRAGQNVFTMEGFQAGVSVGQTLTPGQAIGRAIAGPTGIEEGWANAAGTGPLTPYNGSADGTSMPGGIDYANFIAGLAHGVITGSLGALGASAIPWKNIAVPGVKGTGTVPDIVRAALKKMTSAANAFGSSHATSSAGAFAGQGGSNSANEALGHKMMLAAGWGEDQWPSLDKLWIGESNWSSTAMNTPSMGWLAAGNASGIPQSDGNGQVYRSGDAAGQIAWGLNYIRQRYGSPSVAYSDWLGRSPHWYEQGGLLDGFAAGGTTHARRSTAPKIKAPKPHKPTKLPKLPRLKSLAGFDQTLLNQINTMSSVTLADLSTHEGYIQGLHGLIPFEALVTLADGSQVVNEDGMIDPSTGQWVKGISQRLGEIGAPGNRDISTELGIQDTMLADLVQQQSWAGQASGEFGPWAKGMGSRVKLDAAQKAWLTAATDPTTPYRKLPQVNFSSLGANLPPGVHVHGGPAQIRIPFETMGTELRKRAKEYKDLLAQKLWATKLKEQLPLEKQKRDAALTARFAAARHQIQISGLTSSFDGSQLLAHQKELLGKERRDTLAGIKSAPPASWLGDTSAWHLEHAREVASINDEFDSRATALSDAAAKHKLTGQISRSNALFGLSQTEAADKLAVSQKFGHRTNDLTDLIRSDTSTSGADKRWLGGLLSQVTKTQTADTASLKAGTDPGGFGDQLKTFLDPLGQLSTDILTKQNIDIPALLMEIGQLKGTTAPTSTGTLADTSALNSLLQQQLLNAQTDLAVSQSQFSTLAGFQPLLQARLLGSFQSGTGFVPQTGPYVLHKGEQVIPDPSGPASNRAATVHTPQGDIEVVVVMANNEPPLMKVIDARINKRSLQVVSDHSGQRARLMSGVRRP